MSSLGSASGTLTIDASQAIQSVKALSAELSHLNSVRVDTAAFAQVSSAAGDAMQAIKAASGQKFEVNTEDARDSLALVGTAAEDAAARVQGASGARFDVNTFTALDSLTQIGIFAEDAAARVNGASGASFSINVSQATGDLVAVSTAAQDAAATITAASGAVFSVDTSAAVADLMDVGIAAELAADAIKAASGTKLDIETGGAQGALLEVSKALADLSAQMTGQSMTISVDTGNATSALGAVSAEATKARGAVTPPMPATVTVSGTTGLDDVSAKAAQARSAVADLSSTPVTIDTASGVASLDVLATKVRDIQTSFTRFGRMGLGAIIAGALLGPMKVGIENAAALEQAIKNTDVALGGLSDTDLSKLNSAIREIGTNTQYSAKEVGDVATELAKAGFDVAEQIDGRMLEAVTSLASATGDTLGVAIRGVVQAMATWSPAIVDASIAMTDASRAADILTVAANSSTASVQDIIAGMRNLGPVVSQMGVGFDEASAAISIFTNYGMKGADVGVSLARGLQNLTAPTSEASQLMRKLGIDIFDTTGKFVGLPQLFGQLSSAMRDMSQEARFSAISTLFGAEAMDAYALAVSTGKDPLIEIINLMQQTGVAQEQAVERTQTLSGAYQRMTESIQTGLGSAAQGLIAPLTMVSETIANVGQAFTALPPVISGTIGAIVSIAGVVVAATTAFKILQAGLAAMNLSFGAVTGISVLISGLTRAGAAVMAFRATLLGVTIAGGPLLAVLGAVAVAGVAAWTVFNQRAEDAKKQAQAIKEMGAAWQETMSSIGTARSSGNFKLADEMQGMVDGIHRATMQVSTSLKDAQTEWQGIISGDQWMRGDSSGIIDFLDTTVGQAAIEWGHNNKMISDGVYEGLVNGVAFAVTDVQASTEVQDAMDAYFDTFIPTAEDYTKIEKGFQPIFDLMENPNINQKKLQQRIDQAKKEYLTSPTPSADWLGDELIRITMEATTGEHAMDYYSEAIDGVTDSASAARNAINFMADDLRVAGNTDAADALLKVGDSFEEVYRQMDSGHNQEMFKNNWDRINSAMASGKFDVEAMQRGIADLDRQLDMGQITYQQYADQIDYMAKHTYDYMTATEKAAVAQENLNNQIKANQAYTKASTSAVDEIYRARTGKYMEDNRTLNQILEEKNAIVSQLGIAIDTGDTETITILTAKLRDTNDALDAMRSKLADVGILLDGLGNLRPIDPHLAVTANEAAKLAANLKKLGPLADDVSTHFKTGFDAAAQVIEDFNTGMDAMVDKYDAMRTAQDEAFSSMISNGLEWMGVEENLGKFNMAGLGTNASVIAQNVTQASTALDTANRVIIGNTNAIAQNAQGINDWADKLIGAAGTYAQIDDLLANGVITLQQYNDAQAAGTRIFAANAQIQEQILGIQARQAPLMADLIEKQQASIQSLDDMTDKQQLVALGWMDATEAAQANQIMTQAAAAANGELGASGEKMITQMIQGAVDADPILGAMLEDMQLISIGANGKITVDFSQAQGGDNAIKQLTASIDALTLAMGGVPPLRLDTAGLMDAEQKVQAVTTALAQLGASGRADDAIGRLKTGMQEAGAATAGTTAKIDLATAAATALGNTKVTPQVAIDQGDMADQVATLADALRNLGDTKATPSVEVEGGPEADSTTARIYDAMLNLSGVKATPAVDLTDYASQKARDIGKAINDIPPEKTITITVQQAGMKAAAAASSAAANAKVPEQAAPDVAEQVKTIRLELVDNVTSKLGAVADAVAGLKDKSVTVTADVASAVIGLLNLNTQVTTLPPAKTITITTNMGSAVTDIQTMSDSIKNMTDKSLSITADVTIALAAISNIKIALDGIKDRSVTVTGNVTIALAAIDNVTTAMTGIPNHEVQITGNILIAMAAIDNVTTAMTGIPNHEVQITANVLLVLAAISNVGIALAGIPNHEVQITGNVLLLLAAIANATIAVAAIPNHVVQITGNISILLGAIENATSAINGIPDHEAQVTANILVALGAVDNITAALNGIPDHDSVVTVSGGAEGAANAITAAINAIPSGKTVTVTINTVGSVPAIPGAATGGYTNTTLTRMGERGPEALRFPDGSMGMAPRDTVYRVPIGTYVYTAAETRRMQKDLGIPGYANGGFVTTRGQKPGQGPRIDVTGLVDALDTLGGVTKKASKSLGILRQSMPVKTLDAFGNVLVGMTTPTYQHAPGSTRDREIPDSWYDKVALPKAVANSAFARLDAIATEIEQAGGDDMKSIAESARSMMKEGPVTQEGVNKILKDLQEKGWSGPKTTALANALRVTRTSVKDASDLFSDRSWQKRTRTMANPNDLSDLFRDRKRQNSRDFSLNNGKYTEHYGGQAPPAGVGTTTNITTINNSLEPSKYGQLITNSNKGAAAARAATKVRTATKLRASR